MIFKYKLQRSELIFIYNQSKNNLIFSGRDAFPRVICESSACGCFNIVLDTLIDGKSICNGKLGILIGNKTIQKDFIKDSLTYTPDDYLWNKIVEEINKPRNHNEISLRYKKEFNCDNLINNINLILENVNTKNIKSNKIEILTNNEISTKIEILTNNEISTNNKI